MEGEGRKKRTAVVCMPQQTLPIEILVRIDWSGQLLRLLRRTTLYPAHVHQVGDSLAMLSHFAREVAGIRGEVGGESLAHVVCKFVDIMIVYILSVATVGVGRQLVAGQASYCRSGRRGGSRGRWGGSRSTVWERGEFLLRVQESLLIFERSVWVLDRLEAGAAFPRIPGSGDAFAFQIAVVAAAVDTAGSAAIGRTGT